MTIFLDFMHTSQMAWKTHRWPNVCGTPHDPT